MPAPVIIVTSVSRGIDHAIAEELQARAAAVVGAARNVADVPASANLLPVAADVTGFAQKRPGCLVLISSVSGRRQAVRLPTLGVWGGVGRRTSPRDCALGSWDDKVRFPHSSIG